MRINLRKLRLERGWTQKEAAERLGVSREFVSELENGKKNISVKMMKSIIRVFAVKYEDFY